jgi:ABC-type transporter Mla subunit MlaD
MTAAALFTPDRTFVSPDVYDAFFAVVDRLETTLERETAALNAQRHGDIAEFTRQKRQSFLELNRLMPALERSIPSQDIIDRLARFRGTVERNDAVLRRQMNAVQEVTDLIIRAIRDFESDGTYSRRYDTDGDYA